MGMNFVERPDELNKTKNDDLRNELINYLPKLKNGIYQLAHEFQSGNLSKGLEILPLIIEGLDWTSKAYSILHSNSSSLIKKLNNILSDVNKALEDKSYILVADLFEYEIDAILTNMRQEILRPEMLN